MYRNWVKRIIGVLLVIGIVLGMPFIAQAECAHRNTYDKEVGMRSYTPDGEDGHSYSYKYKRICSDCGKDLNEWGPLGGVVIGESHTYNSTGKCTLCGYSRTNFCDHTETEKTYGAVSYTSEGSEGHMKWQYYTTDCVSCGKVIWEGSVGLEIESHSYSRGKCIQCGYQKSCIHENQEITNTRYEYEQIAGNSSQHLLICYNTWTCSDCGKVTLYDERWYSEEKSHSFNSSGKCTQCGYQKSSASSSCPHSKTKEVTGDKTYEIIEGNAEQHRVVTNYSKVCTQCNKTISTDTKNQVAAHNFNNDGKCKTCGYQKSSCAHTSSTYKKYITDAEYVNLNAEQHNKIRYYNLVCSKCSAVIEENVKGEEPQNHSLDNKGACRYCTYSDISKCKHWSTTEKVIERQDYRNYGSTEHRVYGLGTKTCEECGMVVEENVEVDEREYHTFNGDGICIYCGEQATLHQPDETIQGSIGAVLFPKEGGTDNRCPKGWFVSSWTLSTNVDWITLHSSSGSSGDSFNYTVAENTGTDRTGYIVVDCDLAGKMYAIVIQEGVSEVRAEIHPTLSGFSVTPTTVTLGDSIAVTGTVNGNGAKLTAVSVGVRNYSNQDLGGYWGHQATPNADSFDLSSFGPIVLSGDFGNTDFETGEWIVEVYATTEDGLGFEQSHSKIITINKPACKHENAQPVATGEVAYAMLNDTHHLAQYGYTTICPSCHKVIDAGYGEAKQEEHDFSQSNTCACGYEKTVCQHSVKDAEYISTVSLTDNGDGATHTHIYNAHLTCTECGEYLGKDKVTEGKEEHRLENKYTYGKDESGHWKVWKSKCGCGYVAKVTDESESGKVYAHTPDENGKCSVCGVSCYAKSTLEWTDSVLGKKNTFEFEFDESHFTQPSTEYNHDLSILSLGMVLAVQSDGSLKNEVLSQLYSDFGFHTSGDEVYTTYTGDGINNIACTMAFREIDDDGTPYKLLAVNTRGGNYGTEWVTNFDVGSGDMHRGFAYAASILLKNIEDFCLENGIDLYNENVKIWVTGFSRSAAVSNYVSYLLNTKYRAAGKSITDIYTYTFATPNNVKANGVDLTDGYENIYNIVSSDDLVPMVPLEKWGYSKYGVTVMLPTYGSTEASAMLTSLKDVTGGYYKDNRVFQNWAGQSEAVETTCNWIASVIEDTENFDQEYQAVIDDVASIIFDADKLGSIDAKGETLDKYNAAVSAAIITKLSSTVINKVVPGLGTVVGMSADSNFEYYDKVLDQSTGLFADFAVEFAKLSYEEKSQIVELLTGVSLDALLLYGETILKGTIGVIDAETTDSVLASIEEFMDIGGHITSTHRMETYLAWLLSNDAETLFGN